ncbi:hypothetical protein QYE76_033306 [Lolium multiflorum]|uniref:Protein FAR1-RELATED SEQUENCE n=1 Tax=Lolium multiflorum TaxID=4521 RepID=A0AAD8VM92_LOLMU|nr:hypothetical protein QYE76_033306 [Lolium multiflorum]
MYSWEVGFGIRHGRSRINGANIRTRQDIVCSCEGRDKSEMSRSARCDCRCMLSLLRSEDDSCRQSVRTMCAKLAQESIEGDMSKTIEVFNVIKARDPGFSVAMDLDEKKRVRSLLFAHGTSRNDYASFGDVVTFDTTYRTNLYNLPFGLFVGVNQHFQSIVFAGVLLTEETIDAFKWTFRNFVAAMGADAPKTILTDQCHQMRVAIDAELPLTRHRWCKWHVLRKAKESLGPVYSKNSPFKRDLHELLDIIVDVEEFETRWSELITGYSLQDNEFLSRAYDNREMWAKPYFTSTFCAGMTSTQRSAVEIPSSLIKKRWTTDARDGVESAIPGLSAAAAARADSTSMHGMLHAAVMELVGMGTTSRQAFEVAVDYVSHAKAAISAMTVDAPVNVGFSVQSTEVAGEDVL